MSWPAFFPRCWWRGAGAFARNRAARILLPFVVGWLVLFPTVGALVGCARNLGQPDTATRVLRFFMSGAVLRELHPMHLWFLEYLLFFYVIALVLRPVANWQSGAWAQVDRLFRAVFNSRWRTLVLGGVLFPVLCLMQNGWLDDPQGFAPEGKIILAYLVFFGAGWLLYRQADLLPLLRGRAAIASNLALGLVGWALAFKCHEFRMQAGAGAGARLGYLGCAGFHALAMWGFIWGFTGMFLLFLERPIPWLRYLSDSSYWLYLAHMPVLLVFQIALVRSGWPPVLRMFTALGGALVVLLISYHLLVRPTWVGVVLNGRRYPLTLKRAALER